MIDLGTAVPPDIKGHLAPAPEETDAENGGAFRA